MSATLDAKVLVAVASHDPDRLLARNKVHVHHVHLPETRCRGDCMHRVVVRITISALVEDDVVGIN